MPPLLVLAPAPVLQCQGTLLAGTSTLMFGAAIDAPLLQHCKPYLCLHCCTAAELTSFSYATLCTNVGCGSVSLVAASSTTD